MGLIRLGVCLLLTVIASLTIEIAGASELTGPRYRMFFLNSTGAPFNPEQDILQPTQAEQVAEAVRGEVFSAALKSVLPFTAAFSGSEDPIEERVLLMISNFRQSVAMGVQRAVAQQQIFPVRHSFMLVPNFGTAPDLFYSDEKISMSGTEVVNIYQMTPSHPKFESSITESLKKIEDANLIRAPGSQLLAARTDLQIESPEKMTARLQVVLSLSPSVSPFTETNEKVRFERLVIPHLPDGRRPVAILDFRLDLSKKEQVPPELTVQLGEFESFRAGEFKVWQDNRRAAVPRLEGVANKTGTKFIAINIGFETLRFNLETLSLSQIDTVTRAGVKIGSSQFVVGGFHLESVDKEFQNEINKKIVQEVENAKKKAASSIESQLMSINLMNLLFERILK